MTIGVDYYGKKTMIIVSAAMTAIAIGNIGFAYDTSDETLYNNALKFASRYEYHDGDFETSTYLYPDIPYSSGIETAEDGTQYECPIFYMDKDASFFGDFDLKKGEMNLSVNGDKSSYGGECVLFNGITLVPVELFDDLDCSLDFDDTLYVTTVSKGETTLEILPKLRGMRKNRDEGYYVPLPACARFIDDVLYVPLRALASELEINIGWDGNTHTVILNT